MSHPSSQLLLPQSGEILVYGGEGSSPVVMSMKEFRHQSPAPHLLVVLNLISAVEDGSEQLQLTMYLERQDKAGLAVNTAFHQDWQFKITNGGAVSCPALDSACIAGTVGVELQRASAAVAASGARGVTLSRLWATAATWRHDWIPALSALVFQTICKSRVL